MIDLYDQSIWLNSVHTDNRDARHHIPGRHSGQHSGDRHVVHQRSIPFANRSILGESSGGRPVAAAGVRASGDSRVLRDQLGYRWKCL